MAGDDDQAKGEALAGYDEVATGAAPDGGHVTVEIRGGKPPVRAASAAEISRPGSAVSTLAGSALALRAGETLRMRKLAWGIFGICAFVLVLIPAVDLARELKLWLASAMVIDMAVALWMRWLNDKSERVTERRMAGPWVLMTVSNAVVILCFGAFSAVTITTVLSLYYATQRYGRALSMTLWLMSAALHAAMVTAFATGLAHDPGLLSIDGLPLRLVITGEVLIQLMFAGSYWIASVSRRATTLTMEELQRATHAAAQRDALLVEAREELERALRVTGPGRFTDQVLGSFKLGELLGRGAMGEVYHGARVGGGEPAAVKLLRIDAMAQPGLLARFLREATAIAALDSPHVVRVIETGDETAPLPYIAMEQLVGHDLAYLLRARTRLPIREIIELMRQVASGVDAAHGKGIVHRDLKPQNLFFHQPEPAHDGTWKVLDFGVSKLSGEGGTLSGGHIVGTPAYMAPEQVRGGEVDARTDVYALAVVAFRCLTGELPFRGKDTAELLYMVAHAPTPVPSRRAPGLPPEVDEVIAIGMAKDPEQRYPTAGTLAEALAYALR